MDNISKHFKQISKPKKAFSLIEIIVVVAIFAVVVYLGLPLIRNILFVSDLENSSSLVVSTIRQAQNNARNGLEDSVWGIRIDSPNVIMFRGTNYASRDPSYDLGIKLADNLNLSGLDEVSFSKMYGFPSTTGNIVLTSINGKSITINLNEKGTISY